MKNFQLQLKIDSNKTNFINFGCGSVIHPNYINIDYFGVPKAFGMDFRKKLPISDNVIDAIFSEHVLEHFSYPEVHHILYECYRILKPKGKIRIVLPNIEIFSKKYMERDDQWLSVWKNHTLINRNFEVLTHAQAISFITQEFGHKSCWDYKTLTLFLQTAGFKNICQSQFGHSTTPGLAIDFNSDDRKLVSLYVEAEKNS